MRAGAGHYPDTPLPCEDGNVGIAGHRTTYGKPFANLDQLGPGDTIILETPIGSCTYEVTKQPFIVSPEQPRGCGRHADHPGPHPDHLPSEALGPAAAHRQGQVRLRGGRYRLMKRFFSVAGVVGLLFALWAVPAQAAAPSVRIAAPAAGAVVADSTPNITGDAQMSDGVIVEVTASLSSDSGRPVPPAHRVGGDGRSSVAFAWTPSLPWNGTYTVTLRATGEDRPFETNGQESAEATRSFAVEAPPAKPRELTVRTDPDSRDVDVAWRKNTEPDILGYQVQRSFDGGEWLVAGETEEPFYRDMSTSQRGGSYRYRVVAIRSGASRDAGVASAPSEPATTTVPKPPASEAPSGGSGGGSGSGSGSTDEGPSGDGSQTGGASPGSGGSGSGSSGSSGGSGSSPSGPTISRSGRIDLSGFGSLLDQTRAPEATEIPEFDPGFSESLPFESQTIREIDGSQELAVPEGGFSDAGSNQAELLKFFAAGLLVTVILMHVLWLRGEVERVPVEVVASNRS